MHKKLVRHIRSLRNEFTSGTLSEESVKKDPFRQFGKWMHEAIEAKVMEPNAMTLASVSDDGQPDARIVLLRDFHVRGFSFFTNYKSAKGQEIAANRKVCLNFFWPELQRQVRIIGSVKKLSPKESDAYFASRPRESQIGAHASAQSHPLTGRGELENRVKMIADMFQGQKIPRPKHWGGYLVVPSHIEFWQGRPNRLHDRIVYQKKRGKWTISRLNP